MLHLAIALAPLLIYLMVLGAINLSSRPFLTTGARDAFALALGLSGLVIVGPMELFMPEPAAQTFGAMVWVLMTVLYLLSCLLLTLMQRPRLVIYNVSPMELRALLEQAVKAIDPSAWWSDDTYVLPQAFIQLHLDPVALLRNVSLTSVGSRQSWQSWRRLEDELAERLAQHQSGRNPYGLLLISLSVIVAVCVGLGLARNQQAVAQSLWEMLRL